MINTNGVYCDAMVGQCSALEDYLQRHRDLDLLEKELEVGHKELDFRWALAKDGMATLGTDAGGAIVGLVNEATHGSGFQDRLAVERARLAEEKKIREKEVDMQRKEQEVKILEAQAAEIERRIATLAKHHLPYVLAGRVHELDVIQTKLGRKLGGRARGSDEVG